MNTPAEPKLSNNRAQQRYEISVGGDVAGFAQYEASGDAVTFTHTEIDTRFEGQGLASKLARYALDDVRSAGKRAVPVCKFIAGYIRKHPEYADLVSEADRREFGI